MQRRKLKGILIVAALAVLGVFVAVQLGRQLDQPQAATPPDPTTPESEDTDEQPSSTPPAEPTTFQVPLRQCGTPPGDDRLGETTFIDLDGDGRDEAIGPKTRGGGVGNIIEFAVMTPAGDCGWHQIGALRQGTSEYQHDGGVVESWTCVGVGTGETRTVRLVQISATTSPTNQVSVRQLDVQEGRLWPHRPSLVPATFAAVNTAGADGGASLSNDCESGSEHHRYTAMASEQCGGSHWTIDLPPDWKTPLVGADACAVFSSEVVALPCDCDAVPEISVRLVDDAQVQALPILERVADSTSTTTIAGYPATVIEHSTEIDGSTMHTMVYLVNVGRSGHVVFSASSADSELSWERLTTDLDLIAQSANLYGFPPAELLFLEQPNLDSSRMLRLDAGGGFALYGGLTRPQPPCSGPRLDQLFRLDIEKSVAADITIAPTTFQAVGNMSNFLFDDGKVMVRMRCIEDDETSRTTDYEIDLTEFGSVIAVRTLEESLDRFEHQYRNPYVPFVTADGEYQYVVADGPGRRAGIECDSSSEGIRPLTLLRYGPDGIGFAFRDQGVIGTISRMEFGTDNLVVWRQHSCRWSGVYAGRVDESGYIVDRHLVVGKESGQWVLNAENQIVWLDGTWVEHEPFGGGEDIRPAQSTSTWLPTIEKIDVDNSPGWVMTAGDDVQLSIESVARSFDGTTDWHIGTQNNGVGDCPGTTIYVDHPDGFARVLDAFTPIDGDVIEVDTSEIDDEKRAVVVRARCGGEDSVSTVWFALQYAAFQDNPIILRQADIGDIQSIENVTVVTLPEAPTAVLIRAIDEDGDVVETTLKPVDS